MVGRRKRLPHDAVQPGLPDGAGPGRKAVAAREKLELHIITTKTQTAGVLFRSLGRVELVVSTRDVQHRGTEGGGAGVVPIAGQGAADGDYGADGIRVGRGEAITERQGLPETE